MEPLETLFANLFSGDEDRAEAAASGFATQGEQAVEALREHWQEASEVTPDQIDRRWWVLRALAEIPSSQATLLLSDSLQDPDASLRQCAALGLRKQASPNAVPALAAALEDGDSLCADLSMNALIATGSPAVPALLEVMEKGTRAARVRAVRALALIGDKRAIPALFNALEEESALMEYWASEGLERMGVGMSFFKP